MHDLLARMVVFLWEPSPELVAATLILGSAALAMLLLHLAGNVVRALILGLSRQRLPDILSALLTAKSIARPITPLPARIDPARIWRSLDAAVSLAGACEQRAGLHASSARQLIDAAAFTADRLRQEISAVMPLPPRAMIALVVPHVPAELALTRAGRNEGIEAA